MRCHQIKEEKDHAKVHVHADKVLEEYRSIVESITDMRCATCVG